MFRKPNKLSQGHKRYGKVQYHNLHIPLSVSSTPTVQASIEFIELTGYWQDWTG